MEGGLLLILVCSLLPALASPVGGLVAIWTQPSTLFLSIAVGLAGGMLLGTFAFEMMPGAVERAGAVLAVGGFVAGVLLTYGFDLFINRGAMAGEEAEQKEAVETFHRRHPPRGGQITVLAGGTSAEELIEGVSIGVSAAMNPELALVVGFSILVDNISEALSIGELVREKDKETFRWTILKWTGLIGLSLLVSALVGYFALRNLPEPALGVLLAVGAGGMFYLTVSQLVPEAEAHHYRGSGPLSTALGFIVALILSKLT